MCHFYLFDTADTPPPQAADSQDPLNNGLKNSLLKKLFIKPRAMDKKMKDDDDDGRKAECLWVVVYKSITMKLKCT